MTLDLTSIVTEAEKFAGAPYVYGGTTPAGWDCSGFVQYILGKQGIKAPRTSEQQWAWVQQVPKSELQPGDLVFAQFPGDNASPGHVGIYVGNDKVLSAEDPAQGTGYSSLSSWGSAVVGFGKIPGATGTSMPATPPGTTPAATGDPSLDSWLTQNPVTSIVSGLSGMVNGIGKTANALDKITQLFALLFRPSFWLRIGAFFAGILLMIFGFRFLKGAVA